MTEEDGANGEVSPAARPRATPPAAASLITLFSGAVTLIQPCS